jgi:hypothetical protein
LLGATLRTLDFTQSFQDPCVFTRQQDGRRVYFGVHVDDALCIGQKGDLNTLMQEIRHIFDITEEPQANHYLGFQLNRRRDGAFEISQPAKIARVLEDMGLSACNPAATPLVPNSTISEADDDTDLSTSGHFGTSASRTASTSQLP